MASRRREQTLNVYAGLNKSFGDKLSADVSLAAEQYHTDIWNGWSLYPVANLTYMPAAGHVLQLSLSSDKEYPEYCRTLFLTCEPILKFKVIPILNLQRTMKRVSLIY